VWTEQSNPNLDFDVVSLVKNSSTPMLALSVLLLLASAVVWFTIVLKFRQLHRWQAAELDFERALRTAHSLSEARPLMQVHSGALASELLSRFDGTIPQQATIDTETEYAATLQEQRVLAGLNMLASIASAAPLAGLFGTVYGIMEAFSRIGTVKSASLQVVAPAIGDALVTTILGLFAAIPAVIAVNLLSRRGELLLGQSRAFAKAWLQRISSLGPGR
jgi:biopolymer transport protein TolQ